MTAPKPLTDDGLPHESIRDATDRLVAHLASMVSDDAIARAQFALELVDAANAARERAETERDALSARVTELSRALDDAHVRNATEQDEHSAQRAALAARVTAAEADSALRSAMVLVIGAALAGREHVPAHDHDDPRWTPTLQAAYETRSRVTAAERERDEARELLREAANSGHSRLCSFDRCANDCGHDTLRDRIRAALGEDGGR